MTLPLIAGRTSHLKIIRIHNHGAYLDAGLDEAVLLPTKWIPEQAQIGDVVEVFLYFDSNDQIIATTMKPLAEINEVAYLMVVDVNNNGAFLDWGLEKDLLVPYREQKMRMVVGRKYLVYIYFDEQTGRIAASAKIEQFLDTEPCLYIEGQEVDVVIWDQTELGYKAIIDNKFQGLIYANEVFQPIERGQRLKAFVAKLRDDGKIDLRLVKPGYGKMDDLAAKIVEALQNNNQFLPLNDYSQAEDIYNSLQMSKKNFKKSIGLLFKQRIISIENDGIRLIK